MPKEFSVTAKDAFTSIRYRITPSKESKAKVKDAGKIRYKEIPKYAHPVNQRSREQTLELQQQAQEDVSNLSLLARLTMERTQLEGQLSKPPLIDRIDISLPPYTPYAIPPPLPTRIHFRKTKILHRIKEYRVLFDPVINRLYPLFQKLNEDDRNEDLGLPVKVPGEVRERLWSWWNALNDLYYDFEERGHSLTNKEWRILKGALKSIGKISLSNLNDRLLDICSELEALDLNYS
ncbi:hypothetical protein K435DRAFT_968898 [Dendrothele bispora CBS 962.96]|uniref:Uncharacterized protein n=1 Tax=Dendrothele bispora (strain CBS 962.96) TaxID=1314807 RepID=A0A4S8LLG6_DENBC|nr:hypothetical protein K435DRAFT_968898 [Dendrothele bispora CBS 962.96]